MTRLSILFALLAACGGGSKKSEPTTTAATTTAQADVNATANANANASAGAVLELGDIRLVDVNKNKALLIKANGDIELEGVVAAKVTPDGKIVNTAGEVGFTLLPDGTVNGPDGKPLDVTLSTDAVIKSGDKSISLDANGSLVGANPAAPPMKVEGADTPGKRRTAMFVLIALTTGSASAASGGASGGGGGGQ